MKKVNLFFLILLSVFLVNCETTEIQEDTKPLDSRGCTFDGDDCDDGPGGGSGGPGGGGNNSTANFKIYMRGKNYPRINQGKSSNGTSWSGQGSVTSSSTHVSPGAAYFDNKIFVFQAHSTSSDIKYAWSSDNGTSWTSDILAPGDALRTRQAMSATTYNNAIYLAYTRYNIATTAREIKVYTSTSGTSNWTYHSTPVPGGANPGGGRGYLAVHNNELYIFYVNHSTGQVLYKKFNGSSWGNSVDITGNINGTPVTGIRGVAAYSHNGNLYAVYNVGGNYMVSVNALSSTPTAYYVTTAQSLTMPSLTSDGSKLVLGYRGNNDDHTFYATSNNGQTWSGNLYAVGETDITGSPYVISY